MAGVRQRVESCVLINPSASWMRWPHLSVPTPALAGSSASVPSPGLTPSSVAGPVAWSSFSRSSRSRYAWNFGSPGSRKQRRQMFDNTSLFLFVLLLLLFFFTVISLPDGEVREGRRHACLADHHLPTTWHRPGTWKPLSESLLNERMNEHAGTRTHSLSRNVTFALSHSFGRSLMPGKADGNKG